MPRTQEAFQQIRDSSRQNILEKAAGVFVKKGLANTKISDLTRAAGISQGLLYRYFSDKDDIFITLIEQAIDRVTKAATAIEEHAGTALEKLGMLTKVMLQGISEEPIYFQLFAQAIALSGRVRDSIEKLDTLIITLREIIVEGQKTGELAKRDPDQLLMLYLGCLYGLGAGKSFNTRWVDEHFPTPEAVLRILQE